MCFPLLERRKLVSSFPSLFAIFLSFITAWLWSHLCQHLYFCWLLSRCAGKGGWTAKSAHSQVSANLSTRFQSHKHLPNSNHTLLSSSLKIRIEIYLWVHQSKPGSRQFTEPCNFSLLVANTRASIRTQRQFKPFTSHQCSFHSCGKQKLLIEYKVSNPSRFQLCSSGFKPITSHQFSFHNWQAEVVYRIKSQQPFQTPALQLRDSSLSQKGSFCLMDMAGYSSCAFV